jgi:hypothetical protein
MADCFPLSSTVMFTGVNPFRYNSLMLSILVSSFSNGLMNSKLYFGYRLEILPKAAASPL